MAKKQKPGKEVKKIDLRSNDLHSMFDLPELKGQTDLEELDLHYNFIKTICGIDHLVNLKKLKLSSNGISKISGLDKLINLEVLDISSPQQYYEPYHYYGHADAWDRDYFDPIEKIEGLENLVNLRVLDLSRNNIRVINGLKHCIKLEELYLRVNNISSITILKHLKSLRLLSLANNNFKLIDEKVVKNLPNLKKCDLPIFTILEENTINKYLKILFVKPDYSRYWIYDPKRWIFHTEYSKKLKPEFLALVKVNRSAIILKSPPGHEGKRVFYGGLKIKSENEFIRVSTQFQSWADNDYKTKELSKYIIASILKRLSKAGDSKAKKILKK